MIECIGSPSGLVLACALGVREFDSQQTQKFFKIFGIKCLYIKITLI